MAVGGGGGRGGLGWVILAAALAVPGFLFYNWWSHLKAERDHAISVKASKRADGGVFQTPPTTGRLVNPMASSTAAPAAFAPGAAAAAAPAAARPAAAAAGVLPPAKSSGTAPGASPFAAASAVSLSTASTIVLSRDPMLSPLDAVRLREAEMAEEERQRALAEANNPRPERRQQRKRPTQPPIETRIELQGIVAKPDGDNLAIINGTTITPGQSFEIENYPGKVKVVKITTTVVTLDYKGRKFKLSVNEE